MKLIKPIEISGKILTLLDETHRRLIIVSPYMKISKWYKLVNKLNDLKCKGIIPEIYVRDDAENESTFSDLQLLGLPFQKLPHLHSKLYINDGYAIVTSMNQLLSSDINSLEIGYITENQREYNDLFEYYLRYIRKGVPVQKSGTAGELLKDMGNFMQSLREEFAKKKINAWPASERNALHISTGKSNYLATISESHLRITASKRVPIGKELNGHPDSLFIGKKMKDLTAMQLQMLPNAAPDIIQLSGKALCPLKSTCMNGILKNESTYIMDSLKSFIEAMENLVI